MKYYTDIDERLISQLDHNKQNYKEIFKEYLNLHGDLEYIDNYHASTIENKYKQIKVMRKILNLCENNLDTDQYNLFSDKIDKDEQELFSEIHTSELKFKLKSSEQKIRNLQERSKYLIFAIIVLIGLLIQFT